LPSHTLGESPEAALIPIIIVRPKVTAPVPATSELVWHHPLQLVRVEAARRAEIISRQAAHLHAREAAAKLGLHVRILFAGSDSELDSAFATLNRDALDAPSHLRCRATREGQQGRPFLQLRDIPADKESNYPPVDLLVT